MAEPKPKAALKAKKETTRRQPRPEDFPILFDEVTGGRSMASACKARGIDAPSVNKAIWADENLKAAYEIALQGRGDYFGEQVANTVAGIAAGRIKPDQGRAMMDGLKWLAGQMAPKRWNQTAMKVEHTGRDGAPLPSAAPVVIFSLPDNGRSG